VSPEVTDEVLVGVVRPSSPCSAGTFSRPGEGNFLLATRYSLLAIRSRTPRRAPTRIALQACAVSHQGEVRAFGAAFSDIAFHLGFRALVHPALLGGTGMGAGGGEGEAGNGGFAHGQRLGGDAELLFQLAFQRIRPDGDGGHHAAAALHHGEAFGFRADETARDL